MALAQGEPVPARSPLTLRAEYQLGVTSSDIALYAYNRDLVSMSISFQY